MKAVQILTTLKTQKTAQRKANERLRELANLKKLAYAIY